VSNPFQRKLTTEHKQIHEENLKKRKEELRKMILDDVRASVKGLSLFFQRPKQEKRVGKVLCTWPLGIGKGFEIFKTW